MKYGCPSLKKEENKKRKRRRRKKKKKKKKNQSPIGNTWSAVPFSFLIVCLTLKKGSGFEQVHLSFHRC